ncbi:MAG TPA: hypothetical protein VLV50_01100 [Stellaceae bacterium]|nr:hypothetical protein [Stellaceae bacterium]
MSDDILLLVLLVTIMAAAALCVLRSAFERGRDKHRYRERWEP